MSPRTLTARKSAIRGRTSPSLSGAKPDFAVSPPMLTSSRISCVTPRAAARLSMTPMSSRLSAEWIRETFPTMYLTLFFWRCPIKCSGQPE